MSYNVTWDHRGNWQASGTGPLSRDGLRRMRDVLSEHVASGAIPGLVALIDNGEESHIEAHGTLHTGGTEPMRRDTIFRLASVTKPITAAAVMVLIDECRLRLDDPIDEWLPELANRQVLKRIDGELDDTVPARRSITVRDLLTFTFGFGMVAAMSSNAAEPRHPQGRTRPVQARCRVDDH
ncbi:serine hydrolase domain-containing protein [Nocardia sp. NPDC052566]|uniref:serine hydrolase domain-containing protein n=1 Tax=Nocardia sp. NPDC052566 TaxID=3364330 RepID=UPI0037C6FDD0